MASTRRQVLSLYKCLIRESTKFSAYNFRNYAIRRIRDAFKENKGLTDPNVISTQMAEAERNLEIIKRQVIIGQLYSTDKLVIEQINKAR